MKKGRKMNRKMIEAREAIKNNNKKRGADLKVK